MPEPGLQLSHTSEILRNYYRALQDSDSSLASVPECWQQCRAQAESILHECDGVLRGEPIRQPNLHQATREIAVQRAIQEVPISESIRAGMLLWRAAFPVLRQVISASGEDETLMISVLDVLHQSIAIRLFIGAAAHENAGLARSAFAAVPHKVKPVGANATLNITGSTPLTVREQQVLGGVSRGLSNRTIAKDLGIAEATVKRHMRNIFDKLGAVSRVDAINKAKQPDTEKT